MDRHTMLLKLMQALEHVIEHQKHNGHMLGTPKASLYRMPYSVIFSFLFFSCSHILVVMEHKHNGNK